MKFILLFFISCENLYSNHFSYSSKKWVIPTHFLKFKNQKKKKDFHEKTDLKKTLPDKYLDQVINRKKENIRQCAENKGEKGKNFLVEITVFPDGKTKARLISSSQDNKDIIRCSLNVLNRIQFKKFSGSPIKKGYYFQFN